MENDSAENSTYKLAVRGLYKTFGERQILHDLTLTVRPGEFVSLIGPSGCGKSTLFNILVGLEEANAGQIFYDGQLWQQRAGQFAFMPQRDALLPWRTILDNAILGLQLAGVSRKEARQRALSQFELFGLKGFEKSYPWQLSGGMRQRAALLRTILTEREVLLLDEPFGALDALTRANLQEWLLELQIRLQRTVLFITHDVDEALLLSDRVYVLSTRPATVRRVQVVTLPRPRIVTDSALVAMKADLLAALRPEMSL